MLPWPEGMEYAWDFSAELKLAAPESDGEYDPQKCAEGSWMRHVFFTNVSQITLQCHQTWLAGSPN